MWIVKAAIKNPYLVVTIVASLFILGVLALINMPMDILPVVKVNAIRVLTFNQGMNADVIEKTMTGTLARYAGYSLGNQRVDSLSINGVSQQTVWFQDTIDFGTAMAQMSALTNGALAHLPPNTLQPVCFPYDPTQTQPLAIITATSPTLDEAKIKDLTNYPIRPQMAAVHGAQSLGTFGGKDRAVMVYVDPRRLEARNLSQLDVVNALSRGNFLLSQGVAKFGPYEFALDSNALVRPIHDFNTFPVKTGLGSAVYVRDVGRAEDSYNIQLSLVRVNGRRTVYTPMFRQQGASSVAVIDGVREVLPRIEENVKSDFHQDITLDLVMDQTFYVREALKGLLHEGLVGVVLVALMILLFLGNWRMTLIAGLSIPLAVMGALTGLWLTGNTVNIMTLAGLSLAVGPLVDDAVVELENNHRHYAMGKSRIKAALDSVVEVMLPVLIATSTTIIVLIPIGLMPGLNGQLFRPLTLAVAFAMITSFFLSRTFVPMMCAYFLKDEHREAGLRTQGPGVNSQVANRGMFRRLHQRIEASLEGLTRSYHRLLERALRFRWLVLLTVSLLFVGALTLLRGIGQEFFPATDAGQMVVYVRCPSGTNIERTEQRIKELEDFLREYIPAEEPLNDLRMIISEIGVDADYSAGYTANAASWDTTIRIQLTEDRSMAAQEYAVVLRALLAGDPAHALHGAERASSRYAARLRGQLQEQLRQRLQERPDPELQRLFQADPELRHLTSDSPLARALAEKFAPFADMTFNFNTGGMIQSTLNMGALSPIDVQIAGGTDEQAMAAARLIRDRIKAIPGTADVYVLQRVDAPLRMIEVDRQKAAQVGLSEFDVMAQVTAAMNSSQYVRRVIWVDARNSQQYWVAVQYPEDLDMRLPEVLNVVATNQAGSPTVKLSSLVRIHEGSVPVEISHIEFSRIINVLVNTEDRDLGSVVGDIQRTLAELRANGSIPDSIRVKGAGEYVNMVESFKSIGSGLVLSVLLVYFLLVGLFRSFKGPFVIMFTVPLGLIGVLSMLYLTDTTLNVQSGMGVIFLVGIAVSNGVLLVNFANTRRKEGASVHDAIVSAGRTRFRPILMTFLATALDLTPMAMARTLESSTAPLARAVVGGLITSTLLTLFVVPIIYSLVFRDDEVRRDIDAEIEAEMNRPFPPAPEGT